MMHIKYRVHILRCMIHGRDEQDPFHSWAKKKKAGSQQSIELKDSPATLKENC